MKLKEPEDIREICDDIDEECADLCNVLNRLPGCETTESCMGHGKHPFWIFFKCVDIDTISRLGRVTERNYSDGNWEIVVDNADVKPRGHFWLRTKSILSKEELKKSTESLIDNIIYWFDDRFDKHFSDEED